METEWVLRSRYGLVKPRIIEVLTGLLESREIIFEDEPSLEEALFTWRESSADFADCLIFRMADVWGATKSIPSTSKPQSCPAASS